MKLSSFAIVYTLLISMAAMAQDTPPSADEILKDAYQVASRENKKVFIIFHASWCGWCHKMDKSMNDEICKNFFENNFVIRHLVVNESEDKKYLENPGADELRNKYYGDEQGIPFWLLFDKDGKLLADSKIRTEGAGPETGANIGCPASEKEVAYFILLLEKTTSLTATELAIIRKRFRENEH